MDTKGKVVIIGTAYPYRSGGISSFNERLAREFHNAGEDVEIVSFSLQYPSILFPGKNQYSEKKIPPENLVIRRLINSMNPFNWIKVGNRLKKEKPALIIVRFWLPFMGPAFGTILRKVRKNKYTKIICIADNVIPHEKRPGDKPFTKYFLKSCDAFITMSEKVMTDLRKFEKDKPARLVSHPLYDNFGDIIDKSAARKQLNLPENERIVLFFGFIRKYKGLDLLLDAIGYLKQNKPESLTFKLLIAGEFYEDAKPYQEQIEKLGIQNHLVLRTDFIPDDEVRYYLCAADMVIQPYRNATQSGVTPLAYHFEKPMVVTNVGGLPSLVPHEKVGLVTEPNPQAIAEGILRFYQLGEDYFIPHLRMEKQQYSWANMVTTIAQLANDIQK